MKQRDVDFHSVRSEHASVHQRLVNWARWCRGDGLLRQQVSPMFRGYRAGYPEAPSCVEPIDSLDAAKVQEHFRTLPEPNRWALAWAYVHPWMHPGRLCRSLSIGRARLAELVHEGRNLISKVA